MLNFGSLFFLLGFTFLAFPSAGYEIVGDEALSVEQVNENALSIEQVAALSLEKGWNLVSSPVGENIPTSLLKQECKLNGPVWHWDNILSTSDRWRSSDSEYKGNPEITNLNMDKAYWVYVEEPCKIYLTGKERPEKGIIGLFEGWNMISWPVNTPVLVSDIERQCPGINFKKTPMWAWDNSLPNTAQTKWRNSAGEYYGNPAISILEPGIGYYVYIDKGEACTPKFPVLESVAGEVEKHSFHSNALNTEMNYNVYLPPSYLEDKDKKFPALYLFHGSAGNEDDWLKLGKLENTVNSLIADKRLKGEFVIVMPDMDNSAGENGCSGFAFVKGLPLNWIGSCGNYTDYIVNDLVPEIESKFRVVKDRKSRETMGLSNGAHSALWIASQRPDMFSAAFGLSGIYDPKMKTGALGTYEPVDASKLKDVKVYIETGIIDDSFKDNSRFAKELKDSKVDYVFKIKAFNSHVWPSWISSTFQVFPLISHVFNAPALSIASIKVDSKTGV
ncbi:MAG: hypothetical protein HY516_03460 [Candidatus Aenigmarchaeota archaeon]|nr:hypothetical protein [Candidatus Aenigmarchaeota archaeon]